MKKVLFLAAATAAIVSSCSQSAESVIEDNGNNIETSQTPVNMSVYTASSTRAGDTGIITTPQDLVGKKGFGVFAYQTDATDYSSKTEPNFMYNQQVTGKTKTEGTTSTISWSYSPIKYWPNDNTAADNVGAIGETNKGKVSFFAYAPYANPGENETSGITAVSANNHAGDPTVTYKLATTGSANVDLLWGTAGDNNGSTVNGSAQAGKKVANGKENVNADLTKMKTNGKIQFNFKHALAKFGGNGGIKIKAAYDESDNNTKITVKSITITTVGANADGFTTGGTLNLATGVWSNLTKVTDVAYTTTISDNLAAAIKEPTKVEKWDDLTNAGVTTTAQDVFNSTVDNGFFLIPDATLPNFKVTVDYFVRTEDSKLEKGYSETENQITQTVSFGTATAALNKRYTLTIILGMTSVKFDASVENWGESTSEGSESSANVNLPINVTDPTTTKGK